MDAERVEARLAEGVLRLHLPKAQHLRPRQIAVQTGAGARDGAPKSISAPAGGDGAAGARTRPDPAVPSGGHGRP